MAELQQLGLMPTAEQPQPRDLEYTDMSDLTYLQAVVKVRACMSRLATSSRAWTASACPGDDGVYCSQPNAALCA